MNIFQVWYYSFSVKYDTYSFKYDINNIAQQQIWRKKSYKCVFPPAKD